MKEYKSRSYIDNDSYVQIIKWTQTKNEEPHFHDFMEMVYVLSGCGVHIVNDKEIALKRGDLLFINYDCVHSFVVNGALRYVNICFNPKLEGRSRSKELAFSMLHHPDFKELCKLQCISVSFEGEERKEIENLFDIMLKEKQYKRNLCSHIIESCVNILLGYMTRKFTGSKNVEILYYVWDEVKSYIEDNLDKELTLQMLSKKFYYNPAYFSRAFKKKFNMTLTEYIAIKRMERAKYLLEETEYPMDYVAERVGYNSTSAFYRAFSRIMGKPVFEYRTCGQKRGEQDYE